MQPDVSKFWDRSVENLHVTLLASKGRHFNAAASRYYYAMRLAIHALFKNSSIEGARISRGGNQIEHWTHPALINRAEEVLKTKLPNIRNILEMAKELREKGDYEPFPVTGPRIRSLRTRSLRLFRTILDEIK